MNLVILLHLIFVGLWGGCVAVEMVLEFSTKKDPTLMTSVAFFHDRIDRYVELPLVLGVLFTGVALMLTVPLTALHWVKIACGLGAVSANFFCFIPVFQRQRFSEQQSVQNKVLLCSERIFLCFYVGFIFGLLALTLGFYLQL